MRCATLNRQLLILGAGSGESEINELYQVIAIFIHQNIVKLQVPMHNTNTVHEGHSIYDLVKNPSCLRLRQSLQRSPLYMVIQILPLA